MIPSTPLPTAAVPPRLAIHRDTCHAGYLGDCGLGASAIEPTIPRVSRWPVGRSLQNQLRTGRGPLLLQDFSMTPRPPILRDSSRCSGAGSFLASDRAGFGSLCPVALTPGKKGLSCRDEHHSVDTSMIQPTGSKLHYSLYYFTIRKYRNK